MGLMRFVVSPPDRITEEMVRQAYVSGIDRIPWRSRIQQDGNQLIVERGVDESGSLHLPWPIADPSGGSHTLVTLSTASLMERPEPYQLPLELVRGKISRVRNQLAEWQAVGLLVPQAVRDKITEAMKSFRKAATRADQCETSVGLVEESLRTIIAAGNHLARCYTEKALVIRRREAQRRPGMLGAELGTSLLDDYTARLFLETFNAARVPLLWREVETSEGSRSWEISDRQIDWCKANRLKTCGGPLLQLDPRSVPDWLYLFEDDFPAVLSSASEFAQAAVDRYRGKVDLWISAARANTAEMLSLSEEEMVRLTAHLVELTHSLDPETPVVVSLDQPWAEYASGREVDFPPFHFADALIRANLELGGLMLEINVGYHPGGTLPRDLLEFSRHLDSWSVLGVPLYVGLCVPSSSRADPLAQRRTRPLADDCTAKSQQAWVQSFVPMLLAKSYVHGVFWNQLHDSEPHDFPHGGLFDLRRHPKPAVRTLGSVRQAHLKHGGY